MRILLSDPEPVGDLVAYLRRCGCSAEITGRRTVTASPPRKTVDITYLRAELDGYLRVWRAMHPTTTAELLKSSSDDLAGDPQRTPAAAEAHG